MKILWIKSEPLHPVDKGGKIRTYQMLRHLKRDHEITYVCLANAAAPPEAFARAYEYCHRLVTANWSEPRRSSVGFYRDLLFNLVSPLPYVLQKYQSEEMRVVIERELAEFRPDVVVCDFLTPSVNIPSAIGCPTVLFEHNVETVLWRRMADTERHALKRIYFLGQLWKMQRYERAACQRQVVAAVSSVDAAQIREMFGASEVYDVPTGVDTEFFRPIGVAREPFDLVFTGSMDWMPNEDAILFFADKILPIVRASIPAVKLTVVGRNPGPRLAKIAKSEPAITLTGWVDDVRYYIDRSALCVVPLRVGGGTRIKIYEAMAMKKAVVSTSIGAEGLPLRPGEDIVLADNPELFAQSVVRLLRDDAARMRIEEQARTVVCERFGWDRAASAFTAVCERAVERAHGRGSVRERPAGLVANV